MAEYDIRPIVAVIPDNRDPSLAYGSPDEHFWTRVQAWEKKGWTIGMHGYQHVFCSDDAGVIGLNHYSEFAGMGYAEQVKKLTLGHEIMTQHGVRPSVWIAPAHSFDHNTIHALANELPYALTISDGLFPYPGYDAHGLMWLPQQLWRFRPMLAGVWTVCIHPSEWRPEHLDQFRASLERYRSAITDAREVVKKYRSRKQTRRDKVFASVWRRAIQFKTGCGSRRAPSVPAGVNAADLGSTQ